MVERSPDAPDPNHPLLVAARYSDAESQELGLEGVLERHGLDPDDTMYVAQQRALRMTILMTEGEDRVNELFADSKSKQVAVSPAQKQMVEMLQTVYLDGILTGWRAARSPDSE